MIWRTANGRPYNIYLRTLCEPQFVGARIARPRLSQLPKQYFFKERRMGILTDIFTNKTLVIPAIAWLIAQLIKVATSLILDKKIDRKFFTTPKTLKISNILEGDF